jgi:hypothetical protein
LAVLLALALPTLTMPAVARTTTLQPADDVQRGDIIVQSVGWTLAHANARFCARVAPGVGVMLQDARTFDDPALARQVYGLSGDIGVAAMAADGPAAQAGLPLNATVEAVGDLGVASVPAPRPGKWDRLFAVQDALEQTVARDGRVTLTLAGGRRVTLAASRVPRALPDGRQHGNAGANRDTVRIGRPMAEIANWDEAGDCRADRA